MVASILTAYPRLLVYLTMTMTMTTTTTTTCFFAIFLLALVLQTGFVRALPSHCTGRRM